jgi:periplasmic divalent cation tolerance protein
MNANEAILVLTTVPDEAQGLKLAQEAVRRRLCGCANLLPRMHSCYEWQGEFRTEAEHLLLLKSTRARYAELEAWLKAAHPYELPEIVAAPIVAGFPPYLDWITRQTC